MRAVREEEEEGMKRKRPFSGDRLTQECGLISLSRDFVTGPQRIVIETQY